MGRWRWLNLSIACSLSLVSATALAQGTPAGQPVDPNAPPPGYPPATNAPPPGYQQAPPPGYQAPPPGYQAPPPGYQAPPPGYQAPPPGYGQQPYGAPPPGYAPGYAPQPQPQGKHGFMAMLYLGVQNYLGDSGNGLDTGFRLGTILGGRLSPQLSINGELTIDVLNPSGVPSGTDVTSVDLDIAFSPLFHIPSGSIEIVMGPKLGLRGASTQISSFGTTDEVSASGYTAGLNLGLFAQLSPTTSIGGLVNLEARTYSEICQKPSGFSEMCTSSNMPDADKILGITGAILW